LHFPKSTKKDNPTLPTTKNIALSDWMVAKIASIAANTIPTGLDQEPISKMAAVPTIK
jgi:hypothetical protein